MIFSDILRRIRYALQIKDSSMLELFKSGGVELELETLIKHLKKEDEDGYAPLTSKNLTAFLDGLILKKRGVRENPSTSPVKKELLNNNLVLRKIKIALELREEDILAILKRSEMEISKSELSALFRQKNHKNYKVCGDQLLRNFLAGLAVYMKTAPADKVPPATGDGA